MRRPSTTTARGAARVLGVVLVLALAAPAGAGGWRGHGVGAWGEGWGGHHQRHGLHARGHGDHFAFALSLALPLYHGHRYEQRYGYPARPARVIVYERAPQVVVYRQPSVVVTHPRTPASRAAPPGCRQFNTEVTIAGRLQPAWGIACPQADGSWRVVD